MRQFIRARVTDGVRSMVRGSTWAIISGIVVQGGTLVGNLIVANVIGVVSYGHYALVQSTVTLLGMLAQLGFGTVISQQVASSLNSNPERASEVAGFCLALTLITSAIFAGALFFGRDFLSTELFRDAGLGPGLAIAALGLPWVAAATMQQGLFGGLQRFKDQALVAALLLPVVIGLPTVGALVHGFKGALIGLVAAYILRFAASQIVLVNLFRSIGLRFRIGSLRRNLRLVWRMALPATLSGILTSFAIWGGQTLLVRSQEGAELLGMFAAAYSIKTIVMFIPSQSVIALLPILSRSYANVDGENPRKLLWMSTGGSVTLAAAFAIPGILFAPQIMSLFGEDFRHAAPVLRLLLLAVPIEAMTITVYQDLSSKGYYWIGMLSAAVPLSAMVLGGAALLVPEWGGEGLAIAWLAAWTLALIATVGAVATSSPLAFPRQQHG